MKNDEQIKEEVWNFILSSPLADAVDGVIKRDRRPSGSKKEDVIISMLANENGQLQQATVNVNIYVQDEFAGREKDPKHERLNELAAMSSELFEVFRGDGFRAHLLSQRITAVGEDEHVITNKIEYKQINED